MPSPPPDGPVCHVNLAPGYRGGERQTELLLRELAARGWRQRLVARRGGPLAARCRDVPNLEVRAVASQPLAAAFAARGAALLHAHEARAIYACWFAAALGGQPWLLTRRVDNPFRDSPLRDRAYRAAGCRVAVSRAIRRQVEDRYPGRHCEVVPDAHANLAAGGRRAAARDAQANLAVGERRPALPASKGRTVVGHVGALDHSHKGQGTIIEAARLAAARDAGLHFVLVGDGRDELRFREAAAGLDNVEFAGFVDDVGAWLAAFDLFAFPSLHEGLGSTLLDAMSFGLPIVATRVGGIPDIVEDGVNGLLIETEDAAALLESLLRLRDDAALCDAMRDANLAQAERYSPAAMADAYSEIYRDLLKRNPAA